MAKPAWLLGMTAVSLLFAACVGDEPKGGAGPDIDGSPGGDGASAPDGSKDSGTDTTSSKDADAGPACGFAGEACCAAPFAPCNPGTVCTAETCNVSDVFVIGDYVDIATFKHNGVSAIYDGATWIEGPSMGLDTIPTAIWGAKPGDYRAVTTKGKILLYSGGASPRWLVCGAFGCSDPMTTNALYAVNGFGSGDFWVGGVNAMYRCGGTTCTARTSGLPASWGQGNFAGTSSTDLWYSQFDKAFHFNGTAWTIHPGIQARAIWANAANDVWAGDSALQHYDGANWSPSYDIGAVGIITAMSGSGADDVWAVGYKNTPAGVNVPFSAHWDGAAWTKKAFPVANAQVQSVWAASKKEAFAASFDGGVYKWNGTAWSAMTLPTMPRPGNWSAITGSAKPRR